jgi:kinesin family protein 1
MCPVIVTKDLSMIMYGRDARIGPRSFKSLFTGRSIGTLNRSSAIYELTLKYGNRAGPGSPGLLRRQRKIIDTTTTYVRGEENLKNWRPRGDSLIFDHQWELEKLTRLEQVEKVRYLLLLRERLGLDELQSSKKEKDESNLIARDSDSVQDLEEQFLDYQEPVHNTVTENVECDERQQLLLQKCIKLLSGIGNSGLMNPITPASADENSNMSISQYSINSVSTPSLTDIPNQEWQTTVKQVTEKQPDQQIQCFLPDLEEICLSPIITRKGYLNVLEHGSGGWKKRWVVVRRPYIFIYKSDKDSIERAVLNLSNAQVECSEDQMAMIKTPNTFR